MRNKFKNIFNLQTQKSRIQEKKIALINQKILSTQEKISNLANMLNNVEIPRTGKVTEVIRAQSTISILRQDIQISIQEEKEYKQMLMDEKHNLKMINIELEKSKYLLEEANKEWVKHLQKQEEKQLNDISQRVFY
ncbi:hypothetical protein MNB_ARC-1_847 [hydrothermal vent metagenome]|uniref:Flagellar FliJ protein n=1 Tax=hydrothermal vent metagenome TaxID=652676 RepID=A0A3B1E5A2_9ZZZZ